jgi:hypothetical protein
MGVFWCSDSLISGFLCISDIGLGVQIGWGGSMLISQVVVIGMTDDFTGRHLTRQEWEAGSW